MDRWFTPQNPAKIEARTAGPPWPISDLALPAGWSCEKVNVVIFGKLGCLIFGEFDHSVMFGCLELVIVGSNLPNIRSQSTKFAWNKLCKKLLGQPRPSYGLGASKLFFGHAPSAPFLQLHAGFAGRNAAHGVVWPTLRLGNAWHRDTLELFIFQSLNQWKPGNPGKHPQNPASPCKHGTWVIHDLGTLTPTAPPATATYNLFQRGTQCWSPNGIVGSMKRGTWAKRPHAK